MVVVALGLLSLLTALAALILAGIAYRTTRQQPTLDPDATPEDVLGLRREVAALQRDQQSALKHVAIVRYDALGDMGGQLSWSLALLDSSGNGLILTSIHGRSDSRTYAKSVTDWSCEQQQSPEEARALEEARPR